MALYSLAIKKSAEKELRKIPSVILKKLMEKIKMLSSDPRPVGSEALKYQEGSYRIRQNDYRVVYQIDDDKKEVMIIRAAHRSEVYR